MKPVFKGLKDGKLKTCCHIDQTVMQGQLHSHAITHLHTHHVIPALSHAHMLTPPPQPCRANHLITRTQKHTHTHTHTHTHKHTHTHTQLYRHTTRATHINTTTSFSLMIEDLSWMFRIGTHLTGKQS